MKFQHMERVYNRNRAEFARFFVNRKSTGVKIGKEWRGLDE